MPREALVTSLVPLRSHHEPFLGEAIGSLSAQTNPEWRALVLVEPGDAQPVEDRLAEFGSDSRISIVTNEGRRLAGALNTGMRHADTPFVAELLADDLWSPDAVEVLDEAIRDRPDVDFFHTARRIIDDDGVAVSSVHPAAENVSLADFARSAPVKHLLCWRRTMGLDVGGMDESLESVGPDDFDFPWTMAERGARFCAIQSCLYIYRDHRQGFRLTTHIDRRTHVRTLRQIFAKHRMSRREMRRRLRAAEGSYLRQCLYRSGWDRRLRTLTRRSPGGGAREIYR